MKKTYVGETELQSVDGEPLWEFFEREGEAWQRIVNYDVMPQFMMTLASSADHWLFISSNGGLTCGRGVAERALFPYYTEDKIADGAVNTGALSIIRVLDSDGKTRLWEPFSRHGHEMYPGKSTLEKNIAGSKLRFIESNGNLGLELCQTWTTSPKYGFVRQMELSNISRRGISVSLLDGLRNVMPCGVGREAQTNVSCLIDAYKRTELDSGSGLALFTLSSILCDRPEPSEALTVNAAWSRGLPESGKVLLSERQVDSFRRCGTLEGEGDVRGVRGARLAFSEFTLQPGQSMRWMTVADIEFDHAGVDRLRRMLNSASDAEVMAKVDADVELGVKELRRLVASSDGLQHTADVKSTAHHFANVLFNIMRGGLPADGYQIDAGDLGGFLKSRNKRFDVSAFITSLSKGETLDGMLAKADATGDATLARLCREYLPLVFSRRHGDPSRPWNQFAIAAAGPDDKPKINYQGNWRDIFQNWEAMCMSFPEYIESIVCKFLNASTADGYNPYRLMKDGVDWEEPEPDNPWSSIGYWGDHQIIYLLRLLELSQELHPKAIDGMLRREMFVYVEVPYEIKPFAELLRNPRDSIVFNHARNKAVKSRAETLGADGKLLQLDGAPLKVNMMEKLLVPVLSKLSNFVPGGGIWMNTMRPEWNDANNALAGWGLSMVTTAHIRRYLSWLRNAALKSGDSHFDISEEIVGLFRGIEKAFSGSLAVAAADSAERMRCCSELGEAGSAFRQKLYANGLGRRKLKLKGAEIAGFADRVLPWIDDTLKSARRGDGLVHSYNLLSVDGARLHVDHLQEMLEGQVAALSAGNLLPDECLDLLKSLKDSAIFRKDQNSYMLYPDRECPSFLARNRIPAEAVAGLALPGVMAEAGDRRVIIQGADGVWHFNGKFRNAENLAKVLDDLSVEPAYKDCATAERAAILELFEATFKHKSFTGRSGSFFGYEGLGSIYWHMVAKLLLAIQENLFKASDAGASNKTIQELRKAYFDIRGGLGFNKSPASYGAFPTDPYSHTPKHSGARQPGMTGQVKEEVITRLAEMGLRLQAGAITFSPLLMRIDEFHAAPGVFHRVMSDGKDAEIPLPPHSLAMDFCQVPFIHTIADSAGVSVTTAGGRTVEIGDMALDLKTSASIFRREGAVSSVAVRWTKKMLR